MSVAFYSPKLRCPGVGRDAENQKALCFYFNRPVSDDEMRFLHEVMQRAVACSGCCGKGARVMSFFEFELMQCAFLLHLQVENGCDAGMTGRVCRDFKKCGCAEEMQHYLDKARDRLVGKAQEP